MGCLAMLSRFISHLDEQGLLLYRLLKKTDWFTWTPKAQEALDSQGNPDESPNPGLPTDGELLLLYIAATTQVVSAALVVEREEEGRAFKVQRPMYFVSEVLSDPKTYYP